MLLYPWSYDTIFQWNKGIVSRPIKHGGKLFMAGDTVLTNCFEQIYWGTVLHGGLIIRS